MFAISHRVRKNMIMFWPGAIADIPSGWVICDGTNGTPDMRNLFPVGAGDTYNPLDSTGAASHDHDFTTDGHTHIWGGGTPDIAIGVDYAPFNADASDTGTTETKSNLPPCRALVFIMKL